MGISLVGGEQGLCSPKIVSIVLGSVAGVAILVAGVALVAIFAAPVAGFLGLGTFSLYFATGVGALLALTCGVGAVYLFLKRDATAQPSLSTQIVSPPALPVSTNLASPLGKFNQNHDLSLVEYQHETRTYYLLNPLKYETLNKDEFVSEKKIYKINQFFSFGKQPLNLPGEQFIDLVESKNFLVGVKAIAEIEKGKNILIASHNYVDYIFMIACIDVFARYRKTIFQHDLEDNVLEGYLQSTFKRYEDALGCKLPETYYSGFKIMIFVTSFRQYLAQN